MAQSLVHVERDDRETASKPNSDPDLTPPSSAQARSPSIAMLPSNSLHNSLYILNLNALKDRIAL